MKKCKIKIEYDVENVKEIECNQFLILLEDRMGSGKTYQTEPGFSSNPCEQMEFYLALLDMLKKLKSTELFVDFMWKDYLQGVFDKIVKSFHRKEDE